VTALLALVLVAAPGCPEALARAAALAPAELAADAPGIVASLGEAGAGPTGGLALVARAASEARAGPGEGTATAAFRAALARHCALAASPAAPPASPADRAALAEVLARPELAHTRTDLWALARALDRLWAWLVELLGTEEAERYASVGRALFVGAAAAAAVLAGTALRRRALRWRSEAAGAEPRGERPPPPDASAARAEAALSRGEWREAVRLALLAALGALERSGRVPRGRTLTNDELVASLAAPSVRPEPVEGRAATRAVAEDLSALACAFDRAVYGGLPVAADDARAAVERARRVAVAAEGPA
jgi:hypothetical protein